MLAAHEPFVAQALNSARPFKQIVVQFVFTDVSGVFGGGQAVREWVGARGSESSGVLTASLPPSH